MATDPLAQWWVHRVTIERFAAAGPESDSYDTPIPDVPCFVSDKRRLVLAANGEQVVSETTVLFPSSVPNIPPDSVITLPALFGARTTSVITSSRHDGSGLPTPDHLEVALQ